MYISEFWCGVIITLAAEFLSLLIYGVVKSRKNK